MIELNRRLLVLKKGHLKLPILYEKDRAKSWAQTINETIAKPNQNHEKTIIWNCAM